MRHLSRLLAALFIVTSLSVVATADAADWVHRPSHQTRITAPVRLDADTTAKAVQEVLGSLGVGEARLMSRGAVPIIGGNTVLRYTQTHDGLPVLSTSAAFVVEPDGTIAEAILQLEHNLSVATSPTVGLDKAAQTVAGSEPGLPTDEAISTLAVLPAPSVGGRLVWVLDVPSAGGGLRFMVDAHDGALLDRRPLARNVRGRVYPANPIVTPDLVDVELTDLDEADPLYLNGWSGNFAVTNYAGLVPITSAIRMEQTLTADADGEFLYDPPADPLDGSDAFAQVSIFYHLTRGRDFFTEQIGLDMTGEAWKLTAVANVMDGDYPMDNAFYSPMGTTNVTFRAPSLIAIGQGSIIDFAIDSDVFLHEFTHYVSEVAIGYNLGQFEFNSYGRNPFSGAIDEAVADYFAGTMNGDPVLAESALGTFGAARDLRDKSARCPKDVVGEVHEDGRIIGAAAWGMRETFGAELADQLVWGGTALVPAGGSFGDWGRGIKRTADLMANDGILSDSQVAEVSAILDAQGIPGCEQEIELEAGDPKTLLAVGLDWYTQFTGRTCAQLQERGVQQQALFHFVAQPKREDIGLRFKVEYDSFERGDLSWDLYARENDHVTFELQGHYGRSVATKWDYEELGVNTRTGELVIDANSQPPFDPLASYHIVLVNKSCVSGEATFSVEHIAPEPEVTNNGELNNGTTNNGELNNGELNNGATNNGTLDPGQSPFMGGDTVTTGQLGGGGCACAVPSGSSTRTPMAWMLVGLALVGMAAVRRR